MKRKASQVTVSALAEHLRLSRAATLKAIREAGIALVHVELHYSDDRPRKGPRHWRHLTAAEAERVISYVRTRQGARAVRATPKAGPVLP